MTILLEERHKLHKLHTPGVVCGNPGAECRSGLLAEARDSAAYCRMAANEVLACPLGTQLDPRPVCVPAYCTHRRRLGPFRWHSGGDVNGGGHVPRPQATVREKKDGCLPEIPWIFKKNPFSLIIIKKNNGKKHARKVMDMCEYNLSHLGQGWNDKLCSASGRTPLPWDFVYGS